MRRFLARLVSLVVVLTLLWVVGGRMLADRWTQQADRAWAALGTPMTAFAGRFPKHGLNESARKLDDVAAHLGIGMAAPGTPGRPQPSAEDAQAFEGVRVELDAWLEAQLASPSDRIGAPPENVAGFLSAKASGIRYLVAQLQSGEPAAWETGQASFWEQDPEQITFPFLGRHRVLDRLLCASALESQRQGRGDEALGMMNAAATACASLRERPEIISRVIELAILGTQAGTLRKLERVPPVWYSRSGEPDLRKAMLTSLQAEVSQMSATLSRDGTISSVLLSGGKAKAQSPTIPARISAFYERPYALLAAADYSRAMARTAGALQDQKACAFEPDAVKAVDDRARSEVGRWNTMRLAMPSVARLWTAVDRSRFHQELTAKVLELKALRAASPDGAWPRQVPGIESSVCPGNRWTYVVSVDGGAVLTASQSPSTSVPAVRYEGAPPAPAKPAVTPVKRKSS